MIHRGMFSGIVVCAVLIAACEPVTLVTLKDDTCPLPKSLANTDKDRLIKFSAEASGVAATIDAAKLGTELSSKVKENYPAADDVNRIYALTYAACVSCRVNPVDVQACSAGFRQAIAATTGNRVETDVWKDAESYSSSLLSRLDTAN